jgi:hypothetical protein
MKFIGFLFAALMLLATPAVANDFAAATQRCQSDRTLLCMQNGSGRVLTLRQSTPPNLQTPKRLERIRTASGNPNINWDSPVPPGAFVALGRLAT